MSKTLVRTCIYVAFVLSGATGLAYEVLWSKYLTLFIGGTALSHTIVLATFMGGLAVGNAVFGRLADRPGRNRLLVYAGLEVGIGLICLLFPRMFAGLSSLYVAVASQTGPTSPFNPLFKAVLASAVIFLPCALMGGTLPVLVKYVTDSVAAAGVRLSWLYFLNTVGALAGCLLGGFYIVEHWGLELGMVLTALVNCAIGAMFYALSRAEQRTAVRNAVADAAPEAEPAAAIAPEEVAFTPSQARTAFWCIGAAGALTMLYELVWFRLLVLSIGGTVHSFSTMLVGFIAGIAAGSYLASRLLRGRRNALALFALCELGIALATLVPFGWFEALPYGFFLLGARLVHSPANYALYMAAAVAFAVLLMGLPALLMGAALPLAGRVCVRGLDVLGRTVGNVFSINTAGNVVGALLTGLVVLPALGLEGTLLLGACASAAIGMVLLYAWRPAGPLSVGRALRDAWARTSPDGPRLWPAALAAVLALVAWRAWSYPRWDPRVLQAGLYRWEARYDPASFAELKHNRAQAEVLYTRDGADASLMVEDRHSNQAPADGPRYSQRVVRVNGKPDASTGVDLPTQLFVGHLGMFFHPAPKKVMVVGLGSGATAGAVLRHPGADVDVAEISPEMVEAAEKFESINDGVLRNPRLSLAVLDAREYLLLTRQTYDVIVSEPTNIWVPGVSMLFTTDFYELVDRRLNPGGLFVQWVHSYVIDQETVASTVASLTHVFPYVSLWAVGESDLVFLAGRARPPFDPDAYRERFRVVSPARGIEAGYSPALPMISDPELFLLNQVASGDAVRLHWFRSAAAPYRDLFPRMEFRAARAQFVGKGFHMLRELDERFRPYAQEPLFIERYLATHPLDAAGRERLAEQLSSVGTPYRQLADAIAVRGHLERRLPSTELVRLPEDVAAGVLLSRELESALDAAKTARAPECSAYLNTTGRALASAASVLTPLSTLAIEQRIEACAAAHPARADEFRTRLVVALSTSSAPGRALERFEQAQRSGVLERLAPGDQAALLVTGARLLLRAGRPADAVRCLDAALVAQPERDDARRLRRALAGAVEPEQTRITQAGLAR